MIDKLDLRIPRRAPFTPAFQRKYAELRQMQRGPFRSATHYEYAGDLREYGHSVRLNLYCQMDKQGNHKLELIDVGTMTRAEILQEINEVFEVETLALRVMRVDFAIDVANLPVAWFRQTVRAQHKRFRSAVTGERYYSEMGNGEIQTLYFGKRPNVIRIYDKQAEYRNQYRNMIRKLESDIEPPTFESLYPGLSSDAILTRVERQIGGRVPGDVATLQQIIDPGFAFNPFAKLKIIDHAAAPTVDSDLSFESRCTGLYLHHLARNDGMQAANAFISRFSNGNATRVRDKYRSFLGGSEGAGLTDAGLFERFQSSMLRQLSA